MKPTKLYILRHGESEWNVLGKVQGQEDTSLTDRGREQAKKAAERLAEEEIDIIYSSDLKRAYDTAKAVGTELDLEVNKLSSIREIHFGIWQGLDLKTIRERYEDDYILWRKEPQNLKIENGETLQAVQDRAVKDIKKLVEENSGKNILLESHGTAIKTFIIGLLDMDMSSYCKFTIGNTGISIIEFREFSPVLKVLNDTNHVRGI